MKPLLLLLLVFFVKSSIANVFKLSYDKEGIKDVQGVYFNFKAIVYLNALKKYKLKNCDISSSSLNIIRIGKSNKFEIELNDTAYSKMPVVIYFSVKKKNVDSILLERAYYRFNFHINNRYLWDTATYIMGLICEPSEWNDSFVVKSFSIVFYDTSLNKRDSFFINGNMLDSIQKVIINRMIVNNFCYVVFENVIIKSREKEIIIPKDQLYVPYRSVIDEKMHDLHWHLIHKYFSSPSFRYYYKVIKKT